MSQAKRAQRKAQQAKVVQKRSWFQNTVKAVLSLAILASLVAFINQRQQTERLLRPIETFVPDSTVSNFAIDSLWEPWDSAKVILPRHLDDPNLRVQFLRLIAELDTDRAFVEKAFREARGVRVDFIGQMHRGYSDDPASDARAEVSRQYTTRLLEALHPNVLGIEGMPCDSLTVACMKDEFQHESLDTGQPMTDQEVGFVVGEVFKHDAAAGYWQDHQKVLTVGGEMRNLHDSHFRSLFAVEQGRPVDAEYSMLLEVLSALRSDVALAKIITELNAHHKGEYAVLPFGKFHAPRFAKLFRVLGTRSKIFFSED